MKGLYQFGQLSDLESVFRGQRWGLCVSVWVWRHYGNELNRNVCTHLGSMWTQGDRSGRQCQSWLDQKTTQPDLTTTIHGLVNHQRVNAHSHISQPMWLLDHTNLFSSTQKSSFNMVWSVLQLQILPHKCIHFVWHD